mgnify:CR=1 FL=1
MGIQIRILFQGIGSRLMIKNNFIKKLLPMFIAINLVSCSASQYISSSYSSAFSLLVNQFSDDQQFISRDLIESIPFASASIKFSDGGESLIILESTRKDKNLWISSDRIKFTESAGRVLSTIGLPNDLYTIDRPNIDFGKLIQKGKFEYISYYSFRNPELNNLKVEVKAKVIGEETVSIYGIDKNLVLIEESIYGSSINWKAINKFWVDRESLFVWKSIQALTPKLPYLEISITKKPAS